MSVFSSVMEFRGYEQRVSKNGKMYKIYHFEDENGYNEGITRSGDTEISYHPVKGEMVKVFINVFRYQGDLIMNLFDVQSVE